MSRGAAARLGLALVLTSACNDPFRSGEPCPAWTRDDGGRCVLRAWSVPGSDETLGAPGARDVQLAVGPGGEALLAWAHVVMNADGPVVLAEPAGKGWVLTETRAGEGTGLEPAVALSPDGEALLAWKQERSEGAVYLATRDASGHWRWPDADAPLSWSEAAYEPRVAFGPDGEALVLWNQWTGENFGVALARRAAHDPSAPFERPTAPAQLLSPPVNHGNAPRLAIGDDGEGLVAWYQAPVDDLMVYVSERREPDGAFGRPATDEFLSPLGGPVDSHAQANPWPALHPSGAAAVAWTQQRGPGEFSVYLATRDPDGTWHRPASLDDAVSLPGAYARCPQVAFEPGDDASPTVVLTWFETRPEGTAVVAWRGRSGDGPETRPLVLSTPGAEAVHPALAIAPDGGTVAVWAEREHDGAPWRVLARRHQPDLDRWLPPDPLSEPALGLAPTPQVAIAPDDGRVLVAWAQGGVLDGRVYVAALP